MPARGSVPGPVTITAAHCPSRPAGSAADAAECKIDLADHRPAPIPPPQQDPDQESAFWLARIDPERLLPKAVLHAHISHDAFRT